MVPDFGNSAPIASADLAAELRTREALQESRRRLATLLDNLPGMVYRCRNDQQWTMEFVSEGCRALTGYAPMDLVENGRVAFGDLIVEEDRDAVWRQVQAALQERRPFEITYRLRRLDGSLGWMWEKGQGVFGATGDFEAIEGFITDISEQRQTEQTLRDSEEKFAKAFRASPIALVISEAATGRYVEINAGFERLLGYRREEVMGRTSHELGVWESPAVREDWLARLQRDGTVRDVEIYFRAKDGSRVLMRCSAEKLELAGRACVLSVLVDITAERRTEQALRDSEARLAGAFRVSPDSLSIGDAATGQYLEVNEGFVRLFGYTRDEVIGRTPFELQLLPDPADMARAQRLLEETGHVRDMEMVVTTKHGERRTILHSVEQIQVGGRTCLLRVSHDITQRKQAAEAVQQSEAKFATAFQASPMALTIAELATGRLLEVNHAFELLSGYTRAEALGRSSTELGLWSQADRDAHVARLRHDGHVRDRVLMFRNRAGGELHMRANAQVMPLDGQQCILTVLEDITEQRRAEAHNALLEAQLRQNQKLEALGTLAGGIAHDFNNILTAIVINQELALMDSGDAAVVRQRLGEIGLASNRAKDLVRQILTFSRQQQHERMRQQLQPTVHEALSLVRASLPATIEIVQDLALAAPAVMADAGQIHQIVMNLCTNAAHAMRGRPGCLTVVLGPCELDAAACRDRPPLRPGPHVLLTVADTGHGMEPAVLARIFEPFFTTKGPGEGTGLGLPMVHGIVRDHEGGIFVRSQPGEGTTFELYFPAMTGPGEAPPVSDLSIVRGHGESVLVIDDETSICTAVGAMLGKLGYRVETFCDPEEATKRFAEAPAAFDLVLTDRTMPRVTGPEVIAAIHQHRPGLPALLMSGLTSPEDAAARASGYTVVAKPLEIGPLSHVVRAALAAARPA